LTVIATEPALWATLYADTEKPTLPALAAVALGVIATVAFAGEPREAEEVGFDKETPKLMVLLSAVAALIGTTMDLADVSPADQLSVPDLAV
jgi:hypothetical protein